MPPILTVIICAAGFAVLLFCLVLFMIAPGKKRDYSEFYGKKYAHRGLHYANIPENTIAAFNAAKEANCPIELDVQFTKDKKIVVCHDGNLKRMCGEDVAILDLTYEQLSEYRISGTDQHVPLFSEALEALGGVAIVCEIKTYSGNSCPELCEGVCEQLKGYKGSVCIESFSPLIVEWFRKNRPDFIRGQLSWGFCGEKGLRSFVLRNLLLNFLGRPDFIAYDFLSTSWGFRLCRKIFKPFAIAWTARGEQQMAQALRDYDTVIFEKEPPRN